MSLEEAERLSTGGCENTRRYVCEDEKEANKTFIKLVPATSKVSFQKFRARQGR